MTTLSALVGATAPPLAVKTVDGGPWRLCDQRPESFTLVLFFRGADCARSERLLKALETRRSEFERRGVTVVTASMDDAATACSAYRRWGLTDLTMGYDLSAAQARGWGLRLAENAGEVRIDAPGVFLVDAASAVRTAWTADASDAAPDLDWVLERVDAGRAVAAA